MHLRVRLNDELVLGAGTGEPISATEQVLHPPPITLFQQVLAYLHAKPDAPSPPKSPIAEPDGVAAAAVTLRWGGARASSWTMSVPS